jgi:DNA polymerase III delta prime subunit
MAETKKDSKVKAIVAAGVILLIAGIAAFFLKPSRLIELFDRPIPYIFDVQFYKDLRKYTDEEEHEQALLVYGPHGIGKTRGLLEFAKEIQKEGRLVIDLDLYSVSQHATNADIIEFMCQAIIKSFHALVGTPYKQSLLKQALAKVSTSASYIAVDQIGNKHVIGFIKDQLLQRACAYIVGAVESVDKKPSVKATALFDAIESLKESLRPVIIVHEPWRLLQTEGCKEYCVETSKFFEMLFNGYGNGAFATGLIFDVANQTKIPLFKKAQYRFIRPHEFDPDVAQYEFVDKEKIFTPPQFKSLFNLFGGCGIFFAQAHELLANGYPFNEVVNILKDDLKSNIIRQIKISNNPKEMQAIFAAIVPGPSNKIPVMPNVTNPLTEQLLASNLFAYVSPDLDRVEPFTPGLQDVVNELKKANFAN